MALPSSVKPGAAFKLGGLQQHPFNQKVQATTMQTRSPTQKPAKPDNSLQVLSTKVRASFDDAFLSQVVKAAEKYLGIHAKIAPRVGQVAQVFIYDWEDLETHNREAFEKHLHSFYASCLLAEQGITVEKQDEKEVNELAVRSKVEFRTLSGGSEFQALIWAEDTVFDIQWTTNSAVFCLVKG